MRFYRWNYAWEQLKELYIQKQKEQIERTNAFCTFLMELAQACFGGGGKKETVGLDTGEGLDEMTDEQIQQMKEMLGEADFAKMYPDLV